MNQETLIDLCRKQELLWQRADGSRYEYGDAGDLIAIVEGNGARRTFTYDERRRLVRAGTTAYQYDGNDRLREIDADGHVSTYDYDDAGRLTCARRGNAGAVVYRYDDDGRLILGRTSTISTEQQFDAAGKPVSIRQTRNGVTIECSVEPALEKRPSGKPSSAAPGDFESHGLLADDGTRRYEYDSLGRLTYVKEPSTGREWTYTYPAAEEPGEFLYRFNDARQLIEVRRRGDLMANFEYDHKGRLATVITEGRTERYLYSACDELLLVTDAHGRALRKYVHASNGCVAEIRDGVVFFLETDGRGTCRQVTNESGDVVARFSYEPFGLPIETSTGFCPVFGGHFWHEEVRLYYCGARWYDPRRRRFLTPDSYTGCPDDERLVNPFVTGSAQVQIRSCLLDEWLKQPRVRERYAYCGDDPVNRIDPTGHWSFGGVLLLLLGFTWGLPNLVLGLFIEITCIAFEPVRVILEAIGSIFFDTHPRWTVGFDAAGSNRLSTFALVCKGGWFGSFDSLLAFTCGNIFFVNQDFESNFVIAQGGDVQPIAYNGTVTLNRKDALFEHMLRHANQASWLGPFFHFAPFLGFYWWFRILGGGANSPLERDARERGGV